MIHNWKFLYSTSKLEKEFLNTPKKICVAAHSTPFFDGYILYKAFKYFGENDPLVYARGPSPYFPEWCIQIPKKCKGGFVKNEILVLQNIPCFCRILFPSGGTITWKTGFYVLAKQLDAKIVICGIDYGTNSVIVDSIISPLDTFEETKEFCISRLRKYTPGPLCFMLRVLCNYGCETYKYNKEIVYFYRGIFISILLYMFIMYFCITLFDVTRYAHRPIEVIR
uniref:Phospholipid/glycerol acyltransferase domain-containing protein n=1 Tax=viral metagenome TaxID=1070528 RepID=A0A6C0BUV9_9ZZZZ